MKKNIEPVKVKVLITTEYLPDCPNRYCFIIYQKIKKIPPLRSSYETSRTKLLNSLSKTLKFYNMEAESILG